MNTRHPARLAFGLCLITCAVNLQAPLYTAYAQLAGQGAAATATAFSAYVLGVLPVLLALGGLPDRLGRKPLILAALTLAMLATAVMALWPRLEALAVARFLLGAGTALASAAGAAYMGELMAEQDTRRATLWVTASTSLGFGLGAALTSVCLLWQSTLTPASFWLHLALAGAALLAVAGLPDPAPRARHASMLRPPYFPAGSLPFGLAILLAWAAVGLVIAVLPSVLAAHGLARWSGFSTFTVISCGLLFQPLARAMPPGRAVRLGLLVLPLSYALLAWGATQGSLVAVLLGALGASSSCYGFTYLGGLSAVNALAGAEKPRASAGFFLLAYIGFSLPVIFTGLLVDRLGAPTALLLFGLALAAGAALVAPAIGRGTAMTGLPAIAAASWRD
ncbi:MFS transporter [Chromobacterium aquaticum]|uniref:MFS transporter n=1 Tax=Chromobacterium aquaticum TaxID=467180 RepID=A0ABV8ZTE3_9NEIS|nr:MFS transporter [Chromobacterium aquaticum]MCD5364107.1 MFS transporter [Chromobacterium aquaticum]